MGLVAFLSLTAKGGHRTIKHYDHSHRSKKEAKTQMKKGVTNQVPDHPDHPDHPKRPILAQSYTKSYGSQLCADRALIPPTERPCLNSPSHFGSWADTRASIHAGFPALWSVTGKVFELSPQAPKHGAIRAMAGSGQAGARYEEAALF